MTKLAWISLAAPLLGAAAGYVGLMLAIPGRIVGVFVLALLPVVLLVVFPPLIRGVMGKYGRAAWIRIVFGVWGLMTLSIIGFTAPVMLGFVSDPPRFLPKASDGKRVTRLEFRFPQVTRVVHDPHGQIRFYNGDAPELAMQPDGSSLLVFHGYSTLLSTWSDGVGVGEQGFNIMTKVAEDKGIRVSEEGGFVRLYDK